MIEKTILCLANSRKLSGRCIAGKELIAGQMGPWLRPVSSRPLEEVSEHERQYKDGSDPRLLDLIEVPLIAARPKGFQTENWLLDPEYYWEKVGQVSIADLGAWTDRPRTLWNNDSNSYNGHHDRILLADANELRSSLYLVSITDLVIKVFAPGANFGNSKRRVQGCFVYGGVQYELWITDPIIERQYLQGSDGEFRIGNAYAVVSLGEPHDDGYAYKLIASLFIRN